MEWGRASSWPRATRHHQKQSKQARQPPFPARAMPTLCGLPAKLDVSTLTATATRRKERSVVLYLSNLLFYASDGHICFPLTENLQNTVKEKGKFGCLEVRKWTWGCEKAQRADETERERQKWRMPELNRKMVWETDRFLRLVFIQSLISLRTPLICLCPDEIQLQTVNTARDKARCKAHFTLPHD